MPSFYRGKYLHCLLKMTYITFIYEDLQKVWSHVLDLPETESEVASLTSPGASVSGRKHGVESLKHKGTILRWITAATHDIQWRKNCKIAPQHHHLVRENAFGCSSGQPLGFMGTSVGSVPVSPTVLINDSNSCTHKCADAEKAAYRPFAVKVWIAFWMCQTVTPRQ